MSDREMELLKELLEFLDIPYYEGHYTSTFASLGITLDDFMSFVYTKNYSDEDDTTIKYTITDLAHTTLEEVLIVMAGCTEGVGAD